MPRYTIPKSPGEFEVLYSKAETPTIWNKKGGKGKVIIPCRDSDHADEVIQKIRDLGGKQGEIWI